MVHIIWTIAYEPYDMDHIIWPAKTLLNKVKKDETDDPK